MAVPSNSLMYQRNIRNPFLTRSPASLARIARVAGADVLSLAPLSPTPPFPELLPCPRRRHPLPRARRRRSINSSSIVKNAIFSPPALRSAVAALDLRRRLSRRRDGAATACRLPGASAAGGLPEAAAAGRPPESAASGDAHIAVSLPLLFLLLVGYFMGLDGRGRGGWALLRALQPSQSRAGSSSPRLADVVEYIF